MTKKFILEWPVLIFLGYISHGHLVFVSSCIGVIVFVGFVYWIMDL